MESRSPNSPPSYRHQLQEKLEAMLLADMLMKYAEQGLQGQLDHLQEFRTQLRKCGDPSPTNDVAAEVPTPATLITAP